MIWDASVAGHARYFSNMGHDNMPTKSYQYISLAIALLGVGLIANAAVQLFDHHGGWASRTVWGRGVEIAPSLAGHTGSIQAFPVQMGRSIYGFVLLDPRRHSLAVYRLDGDVSRLRLLAARNYRYDLRLKDFNNSSPTPVQVKKLLGMVSH